MRTLRIIALTLVIIGALNWGLIGLFNFDLVAALFGGQQSALARIIYALVGISGVYALSFYFTDMVPDDDQATNINRREPSYGTEFGEDMDIHNKDDIDKQ